MSSRRCPRFEGFDDLTIDTGDAMIRARRGGEGRPVLLLHGIPQTHVMSHKVAPRLGVEVKRQLGFARFAVVGHDRGARCAYRMALDHADRGRRRVACPVLALWSARGSLQSWYDVIALWRAWADDVRGKAIDCGHFLAEEAPDETSAELRTFLAG